ncbi:MAG: hypothetical protein D6802_08325 [Ardenticatenia bacterium]|nr:MAG: hypothetical protein D6802_08325 [Ardenticatenia bacterium]
MKGLRFGLFAALVAAVLTLTQQTDFPETVSAGGFPTPSATGGTYFVHIASADNNVSGYMTEIQHPLLDEQPNAIFFVTPVWGPLQIPGVYYEEPFGVIYSDTTKRWRIFSQGAASIPNGAAFNIYIPDSTIPAFVHTATTSNTTDYYTEVSSPYLTAPDDIVLVTQRWGANQVMFNNHHIGVSYDGGWFIFNHDQADIANNAEFNVAVVSKMNRAFQHFTTSANVSGHISYISHPLTDNRPEALLMSTPGSIGAFNPHGTGVWYNTSQRQWSVFNQDLAAMPASPTPMPFHMLVAPQTPVQFSKKEPNPTSNYVLLDHPLLDNNIGALVFATTRGVVTNESPTGVFFSPSTPLSTQGVATPSQVPGQWAVYNEDLALMPDNIEFNIFAPPPSLRAFVHTTTSENVDGHRTILDHPMLNNNPDAIAFVEHSWNPNGAVPGTYHDHYVGLYYDQGLERWVIFNQDLATMATGRFFNVFVANNMPNAFIHQVTNDNGANGTISYLDSPLTNGNPAAIIIITPRYGFTNNFPVGVWYHPTLEKWAIVSQDGSPFSNLHQFNVLVVTNSVYLPLVTTD